MTFLYHCKSLKSIKRLTCGWGRAFRSPPASDTVVRLSSTVGGETPTTATRSEL